MIRNRNMTTEKRVNDRGLRYLADWIKATAKEGEHVIDAQNLDAWATEAEESMGNGNPPMVEMNEIATISGRPETFTIPADGIYEQEIDA